MEEGAAGPRGRFGGDFYRLLSAQTISSLGTSFTLFALPLLVYALTGSAINLALVTAAEYLPYLLFGLFAGAAVDRMDRRRLMVFADLAQVLVISSIPLLFLLGALQIWWIYAAGFLSSTLWLLFNTAEFAAVPSLVRKDDLATANGRMQAGYAAASVAGPVLAGALAAFFPVPAILLFDALSFLVSALLVAWIRTPFSADKQQGSRDLRREVAEGLRYVWGHPVLRSVTVMMALVNCVGFTVYAQLVLFAKDRLDASDFRVGILYAVGSAGMILLALAAGPVRRRLPFGAATLGTIALGGALIVLLSLTRSFWVAAGLWALIWGFVILFQVNTNSLWQEIVPNRLLGRVQGIVSALSWSAIPLGTLIGGLAIERTGSVALVYGAIGAAITLSALAFSFTALGNAERYLHQEDPEERGSPDA